MTKPVWRGLVTRNRLIFNEINRGKEADFVTGPDWS
jgi:hypothetical protein